MYPPPYSSEVILVLATLLADNPGVPSLVLGDFNRSMYSNPSVDRYPARTQSDSPFSRQISEIGLRDLWRQGIPSTL